MHVSVVYENTMQSTETPKEDAISTHVDLCSGEKLHRSMIGILFRESILRVRSSQSRRVPIMSWLTREYLCGAIFGIGKRREEKSSFC
jgi:hypothetical protein